MSAPTAPAGCYRHPAARVRAVCPDCGRGMCGDCFEAAAWPWKVCADCQPAREAAQAAAATAPPAAPAPPPTAPSSGAVLPASTGPLREPDDDEELPQLRRGSLPRVVLFLAVATSIPLLAWAISAGIQGVYEGGVQPIGLARSGIGAGRITAGQCQGGSAAMECLGYNLARFASAATPAAVLVGPALVVAITIASWFAGRSRLLLLLTFVPGAYVTLLAMTALVALQSAIVLATLFAISFVAGGVVTWLVLVVGLVGLYGVVGIVSATLRSVRPATSGVFGLAVGPDAAPRLWAEVRAIADRLRAKPPDNVVLGIQPGFWVTEARVAWPGGILKGRTMYLSLAEARVLSRQELAAIVGHELAHYKGFDTRLSHFFYPVYAGIGASLAEMESLTEESWVSWLTMLPAQVVLEFFFWRFAAAENTIGRRRELAADAVGASATSPRTAAAALVKVHACHQFWTSVRGLMRGAFTRGQPLPNASLTYAETVRREISPAVLEGLGQDRVPHPTDSHPTLDVRLQALGFAVADVAADALDVDPPEPAVGLVDDAEKIEEALSAAMPERMTY